MYIRYFILRYCFKILFYTLLLSLFILQFRIYLSIYLTEVKEVACKVPWTLRGQSCLREHKRQWPFHDQSPCVFSPGQATHLWIHTTPATSKIWRLKLLKYAWVSVPGNTSPPAEAQALVAAAGDLKRWQSDHIKLSEGRGQCWREQVVRSTALCPPHLPSICMKMEEIWDMDWGRSTGSFRMLSRATDWSLALASARWWGQTRKANRLDYWKSAPSSCKTVTQLEMTTIS